MLVHFNRLLPRHRAWLETLFDLRVYKSRGVDEIKIMVKFSDERRFKSELLRLRIADECHLLKAGK